MDDGFKYIEAKGDVLEATYPYTGKTGTCSASKSANPSVHVAGFKDVQQNSEAQLMAAVEKAPVSVAIEADQSGFQFYKSGVFSGTCGTKLDHGVLVVGYGSDGGKAYWKVKNSWGPTWGQAGYIMMAKDISSPSGQCGIAMQPSYPTMGPPGPPSPPAPPTPTPPTPPPTPGHSHYGNPSDGCESDEEAVRVQGVPGSFCSPDCKSTACPTDVPSGVVARPQCALQTTGGDKKCALICSPTTDEASLRAGDAQCGEATCQPIQGVGLCTYGAGPSPPSPSPSPPGPSGECTIATGLECAEDLEKCIGECKEGIEQCIACLGGSFAQCCPCLKKVDPNLPISCGRRSVRPKFMEVQTKFLMTVETKFVN